MWCLTTVRALGREDGLRVRTPDGRALDAELAGWDPTTNLAVLRAAGLELPPARLAAAPPRVGHLALAVARSWSNVLTASAGIVSVIGGPLPTGRGARDRSGHPHDGADARRLCRRRVPRHRRRADRHRHRRRDSRPRRRDSGVDRVEDRRDAARARRPEARLSRARRSAGAAARGAAERRWPR